MGELQPRGEANRYGLHNAPSEGRPGAVFLTVPVDTFIGVGAFSDPVE